jgi:hypothetical protein
VIICDEELEIEENVITRADLSIKYLLKKREEAES